MCVCVLEFSDCKILILICLVIVRADILKRYSKDVAICQIAFSVSS